MLLKLSNNTTPQSPQSIFIADRTKKKQNHQSDLFRCEQLLIVHKCDTLVSLTCMYRCIWVSATTRVRFLSIFGCLQPFVTSHSHGTKPPCLSARDELGQDKNDVISTIEYRDYQLTKACSPVGLISLKWIEYRIQYHKGQGSIPGQT